MLGWLLHFCGDEIPTCPSQNLDAKRWTFSKTKIDTSRSGHGLRQCATDLSDRKENCSFEAPPEIVSKIVAAVREDQNQSAGKESAERTRLETRLTSIRSRMDAAYVDKLDGKIPEDFWQRKMSEWQTDEQQVRIEDSRTRRCRNRRPSNGRAASVGTRRIRPICCTLRGVLLKKPNCSECCV